MRRSGRGARVIETPKYAKVILGWGSAEEKVIWCILPASATRADVDQERRRGQGIRPEAGWDVGMK